MKSSSSSKRPRTKERVVRDLEAAKLHSKRLKRELNQLEEHAKDYKEGCLHCKNPLKHCNCRIWKRGLSFGSAFQSIGCLRCLQTDSKCRCGEPPPPPTCRGCHRLKAECKCNRCLKCKKTPKDACACKKCYRCKEAKCVCCPICGSARRDTCYCSPGDVREWDGITPWKRNGKPAPMGYSDDQFIYCF